MASFYDSASIITIPSGYKAGTLYSQIPTDGTGDMSFTRTGDTASRVNSAGIIERCITNLFLQSNVFSNASWTKTNTTIASGVTDPNGGTTAYSLAGSSSTSNTKLITQSPFTSATDIKTISIYAKANTHSFIQVRSSASGYFVNFDLSNGTFSNGSNAVGTMTSIGGGWYRCQMTFTTAATSIVATIQLVDSLASTINEASTTTNSVYIWRAQAETGDFATNYIDTTTAAVTTGPVTNLPRLDYLGSTCPQLLMEPTRTNLFSYSQMFNIFWTKTTGGTGSSPVITANQGISPDGYQNADLVFFDISGGTTSTDVSSFQQSPSLVSGTTYVWSFYAKTSDGTNKIVNIVDSAGLAQLITITPNWQRFTKIFTATATGGGGGCRIRIRGNEGTSKSASIYFWGAQCEAGAYATSYIPTTAATVTRNNDVCNKTSASALIGQTEGTLYAEFKVLTIDGNSNYIALTSGAFTNSIILGKEASTTPDKFLFYIQAGGVVILNNTATALTSSFVKCAIAYKSGDWAAYFNGTQVASGTSTFTFNSALSIFGFGSNASLSTTGDQTNINQALVFKTRLSNADLATLTTL